MALRPEEARVLACLVEKQVTVPDSYPLTLNSLRLACNQSTNRHPVVTYDDRTVETALISLKSQGLVRFVHPVHGRTVRYRHCADERWGLGTPELGVLAMLTLRGAQTAAEVRARTERHLDGAESTVDEILDMLAARSPEPFVRRLDRRPGEREARFVALLTDPDPTEHVDGFVDDPNGHHEAGRADEAGVRGGSDEVAILRAEVDGLRVRLDRLEEALGINDA
jgi:uncharacterized protein YceH (UPF0502 family)